MANNIKGITVEIGGNAENLNASLKGVNGTAKDLQSELQQVQRQLKFDPTSTELLTQKGTILRESISTTEDKLKQLEAAQSDVEKQFQNGNLGEDKYRAFQRELEQTKSKLEALREEQNKFGGVAAQKVEEAGKKIQSVGNSTTKFGESLSKNVSAPIAAIGAASIAAFSEVDGAMDTVATKTGATGKSLEGLQGVAEKVATTIPTSFEEAGNAVGDVNQRFGVTGKSLEDLSEKFIKFAQINNTDVDSSVEGVQEAMSAFGLKASDTQNVLGLLTSVSQKTGVSVGDLTNDLSSNVATFQEAHLSIGQATTLLGNFEKAGLDSGTMMSGLKKAASEYSKEGKSMSQGLGDLITRLQSSKTEGKATTEAYELFGTRGGLAFVNAAKSGKISLSGLSSDLSQYGGTVNKTFDATLDPIDRSKVALNQLKAVGAQFGTALQTALAPVMEQIIGKLKEFTNWFKQLSPQTQQMIIKTALIAAAIGPLLIIIGKITSGIGVLTSGIGKTIGAVSNFHRVLSSGGGLAKAFSAALTPGGAVLALIAAIAVAAVLIITHWTQIKTFFIDLWNTIKGLFGNIGAWFTSVFSSAASGVQGAWSGITGFFSGIWSGITGAFAAAPGFFSDLGGKISGAFQKTGNFLKDNWKSVALGIVNPVAGAATLLYKYNPGFKAWADSVMATIKNGFTSGINAIKGAFAAAINAIKAVFTPFFTGLQTTILSIWTPIKNGLMQAWDGIKTAAQGAWEIIKNVIMGPILLLIDLLTGNFGKFKDDLANIWSNIQEGGAAFASGFVQIFTGLWDAISGAAKVFAQMVVQVFVQTWNDITTGINTAWSAITSFFSSTWDAISGGLKAFWNALPGFFSNLWVTIRNGITAAWNAVLQFFTKLWVDLGNGIKSAWTGFWTTINNLCSTIKNGIINIWNSVISWFRNLPGTLRTIGANMFTSMQNGVNSTINNVTSAIKTGIGAAIDWIKALPGEAIQWGRDIINGIVQGIKDAADAVGDAVKGVAQNIRKFLHFSEPDEGPLVGFGSWMPDMMDQIVSGIKGNLGRVSSAANEVAQAIAASIPALDSSAQVHVALAAAYGGYSAPAPANAAYSDSSTASGGVVINQHNEINSPKALSPAEISRNRRNENRQLVLALKKV